MKSNHWKTFSDAHGGQCSSASLLRKSNASCHRFGTCSPAIVFYAAFLILALPASSLTIIPTFDSSITNDPQAATIENTINLAIQVYEASFSDPITVPIEFSEMSSGLGASSVTWYYIPYSSYLAALTSHATTAYDTNALAHLPNGPGNPVNGDQTMNIQTPTARALGFIGAQSPGQVDGTVYLNTSMMNLDRTSIDPRKFDLMAVASHEMDEVLGLYSALNGLANGAPSPTGHIWPMDLFRYAQSQDGTRSFDTALATQSYFSLDGTNLLARFNQKAGLDFGDWYGWVAGVIPQVQDSATDAGTTPDLGIEKIALDVIGFTLVPSSLAPVFSTETSSNGTFNLTWSSVPALSYQLQSNTNLASTTAWTNVGGPIIATNITTSASDSIGPTSQKFYRAILLPP